VAETGDPREPTVGAVLRRARAHKGVDMDDASRATRIAVRHLDALERDAPLGAFPAPVYARGFLRQYARYLGLDERPLLERFGRGQAVPDPVMQMYASEVPVRLGHRWRRLVLRFR
jgi:cytoskeleton protein RodZ